jgi:hypothetical protein
MGTYDLTVNKTGGAVFSSTHQYLSLTVPIKIVITGQVNKECLGLKLLLNCLSEIVTNARLDIKPMIKPPESNFYCDGLVMSIKPLLEQLVASKKQEWEQKLEKDILTMFKRVGV